MQRKLVLHILMSQYLIDSRVRNETTKLVEEGLAVDVYCLNGETCKGDEIREGVKLYRFGSFNTKLFLFLTAYITMIFSSFKKKYNCVHAHDLTALPIAFCIAKLKRVPLIYDSHELWSQALHHNLPVLMEKGAIWIEKKLARRADYIITVSNSIAEYLKDHFNHNQVYVVRNVPSYIHTADYDLFRSELNIPKDLKIILYQGLISEGRGVHYLVDAAILLSKKHKFKFILLGYGPYIDELKKKISEAQLEDTILLMPAVKQDQLLKYTSSADIGVHAINNSCLNHDYCLPNKLFEYISGGLAVVVTNLTELSKFVNENKIGSTFEDDNAADLAQKLSSLLDEPQKLEEIRVNSRRLRQELTWENEAKILMSIYEKSLI